MASGLRGDLLLQDVRLANRRRLSARSSRRPRQAETPWFSGGTIVAAFVQRQYYQSAPGAAHFEDGTINYLNLPAVEIGLRLLDRVGIDAIHARVGALGAGLLDVLGSLRHSDGSPAATIYGPRGSQPIDDYIGELGLPAGGAIRASFGLASNFADLYRLAGFAGKFVDLTAVPADLPAAGLLAPRVSAATRSSFLSAGATPTLDAGISVQTATDVAKDAADIVLVDKDLGVLADGIAQGRRIFANTIKYVPMGTSSNFGNIFSAGGASLFLGFLPMLPSQILLNDLLYDIGEMTIPADNVDEEQLQKPAHCDIGMIRRLMVFFDQSARSSIS